MGVAHCCDTNHYGKELICLINTDELTSLLDTMGLPEEWHVVEPVPGDLRNIVWIQNAVKGLDGYFEFSPADSDDLDDEQVKRRIYDAVANATDKRLRS